jgi:ribonuclease BN (tRNA processing enzyme)
VRLKILGTGTAVPSLTRGSPAYLLSAGSQEMLIDIGPSVVRRLVEYGHSLDDIDAIFLTHFHVDHSADLATFLFASNYGEAPRTKPLLLAGGTGTARFYSGLRAIYPWIAPLQYALTILTLPAQAFEIGGLAVAVASVNHRRESIAIRFQGAKSVTFSGDTDYSRALVRLARETDLLVTECAFPETKVKGHLNLETVERIALESQARRVLLSHLYPPWETFRGVLHGPYLLAEDGMDFEL